MTKKNEENNFVYQLLNGDKLTTSQFLTYFEDKVFKTIRKYKMISQTDKIIVALSGGKDSITTLYLLKRYMEKRNLQKNITALLVDEGIKNYRDISIEFSKKFCKDEKIELLIESFKQNFKTTQDENVELIKKENISPCNCCGTFRRNILNKTAKKLGATKVATGHNLDDESQSILLNIFKNNFEILSRSGPVNGITKNEKFITRIKPLYFCSEKEVKLYTYIKKFGIKYDSCPYSNESFRDEISEMINQFEDKHKGVKQGIVNFFLSIKKDLETKSIKEKNNSTILCMTCKEPSKQKICNSCKMVEKLKSLTINQ